MSRIRRRRFPVVRALSGLATLLVVAACGGSAPVASEGSIVASPGPPASTAPPTATASLVPSTSPATVRDLIARVGDDERRVRVFAPDPAPNGPLPLLVFLHAFGETPSTAIHDTRFDQLAATGDAIVAFPPARERAWEAQVTKGLADSDIDEIFLGGLIDQLIDTYPVDPDRVYVAGFSMGAVMAGRLACRLADRIAAVAIVAGTPWIGECRPIRPVSVLIIHGTGDSTFRYEKAAQMAAAWRTRDRCPSPPEPEAMGDGATITMSRDCAEGSAVSFVSVGNGRHVWFTEPDATTLAWDFLVGQRRE